MGKRDVAADLIRDLNRLSRSLRMNETRITAAYARLADESRSGFAGITATDALVLEILGDNPGSNGQFVAERIGMTKGGVSKVLARLQEKKLIKGGKDTSDYKSIFYTLTSSGRKVCLVHEKMLAVASGEIHKLIADYSDSEIIRIREFIAGASECLGNISAILEKRNGERA